MANICIYTPDPNILTQAKVNREFALLHRTLCYLMSLSTSSNGPTGGVAGQVLVSNGATPSTFQTVFTKGTSSFTANGTTSVLTIAHGLGSVPSNVQLTNLEPLTQNLLNRTITLDATNITVTYSIAPLAGENAIYHWIAYK